MRPKSLLAPLIFATLTTYGPLAPAQDRRPRQGFDHYDPIALNESAVASVREGDHTSAWILLERASRLAPHDVRIERNLAVLRAYREGKVPAPEGPLSLRETRGEANTGSVVGDLLSEPPPIWTAK